jgi:hemoglobin-like flavoprotein
MNERQIELVQQTFQSIQRDILAVGTLFYHRMFEIDPSLQSLFKGDLKQQAHMLMTSIGMAVQSLDSPAALNDKMRALGGRHIEYGVQPTDFDTFSAALMWTLEQSLADDWTAELRDAWILAFEAIRVGMKLATK